jgi:hypothetical protein
VSNYNTSLYDLGDVIPQSYHPVNYSPKTDGIDKFVTQKRDILQPVVQHEAIIFSMVKNMVHEQPAEENHETGHALDLTA